MVEVGSCVLALTAGRRRTLSVFLASAVGDICTPLLGVADAVRGLGKGGGSFPSTRNGPAILLAPLSYVLHGVIEEFVKVAVRLDLVQCLHLKSVQLCGLWVLHASLFKFATPINDFFLGHIAAVKVGGSLCGLLVCLKPPCQTEPFS